jgi:hypothetical protein
MGRLKGYLTYVTRGYALAAAGAVALVVLVVMQRDAAAQQRTDVYRGQERHAPTTPSVPPPATLPPQRWEYAVLRFEIGQGPDLQRPRRLRPGRPRRDQLRRHRQPGGDDGVGADERAGAREGDGDLV